MYARRHFNNNKNTYNHYKTIIQRLYKSVDFSIY